MTTARKIITLQKATLFISLVALGFSITSLVISSKCDRKPPKHFNNDRIHTDIDQAPDVEVVKSDGSVVKVQAVESKDPLSMVIVPKENPKNVQKNEKVAEKKPDIVKNPKVEAVKAPVKAKENKEVAVPNKISGRYVIQAGAFNEMELAQKQCKKIAELQKLPKGTFCAVANRGTSYRTIIYPFNSSADAQTVADILAKSRINCLVKLNA